MKNIKCCARISSAVVVFLAILITSACNGSQTARPTSTYANSSAIQSTSSPLTMGVNKIASGQFQEAEQLLLQAKRENPNNPWVFLNLGVVFQQTGRLELAGNEYQKIISGQYDYDPGRFQGKSVIELAKYNLELIHKNLSLVTSEVLPNPLASRTDYKENRLERSNVKGDRMKAVLAALENWRTAWVNRDIDAYFGAYQSAFKGAKDTSVAWRQYRKSVLSSAGEFRVVLDSPEVEWVSEYEARVKFRQSYSSSRYSDKGVKTIVFLFNGDKWLINNEVFDAIK